MDRQHNDLDMCISMHSQSATQRHIAFIPGTPRYNYDITKWQDGRRPRGNNSNVDWGSNQCDVFSSSSKVLIHSCVRSSTRADPTAYIDENNT